jgi:hypothetical protein
MPKKELKARYFLIGGAGDIEEQQEEVVEEEPSFELMSKLKNQDVDMIYEYLIKIDPKHSSFNGDKREYIYIVMNLLQDFLSYQAMENIFLLPAIRQKLSGGNDGDEDTEEEKQPEQKDEFEERAKQRKEELTQVERGKNIKLQGILGKVAKPILKSKKTPQKQKKFKTKKEKELEDLEDEDLEETEEETKRQEIEKKYEGYIIDVNSEDSIKKATKAIVENLELIFGEEAKLVKEQKPFQYATFSIAKIKTKYGNIINDYINRMTPDDIKYFVNLYSSYWSQLTGDEKMSAITANSKEKYNLLKFVKHKDVGNFDVYLGEGWTDRDITLSKGASIKAIERGKIGEYLLKQDTAFMNNIGFSNEVFNLASIIHDPDLQDEDIFDFSFFDNNKLRVGEVKTFDTLEPQMQHTKFLFMLCVDYLESQNSLNVKLKDGKIQKEDIALQQHKNFDLITNKKHLPSQQGANFDFNHIFILNLIDKKYEYQQNKYFMKDVIPYTFAFDLMEYVKPFKEVELTGTETKVYDKILSMCVGNQTVTPDLIKDFLYKSYRTNNGRIIGSSKPKFFEDLQTLLKYKPENAPAGFKTTRNLLAEKGISLGFSGKGTKTSLDVYIDIAKVPKNRLYIGKRGYLENSNIPDNQINDKFKIQTPIPEDRNIHGVSTTMKTDLDKIKKSAIWWDRKVSSKVYNGVFIKSDEVFTRPQLIELYNKIKGTNWDTKSAAVKPGVKNLEKIRSGKMEVMEYYTNADIAYFIAEKIKEYTGLPTQEETKIKFNKILTDNERKQIVNNKLTENKQLIFQKINSIVIKETKKLNDNKTNFLLNWNDFNSQWKDIIANIFGADYDKFKKQLEHMTFSAKWSNWDVFNKTNIKSTLKQLYQDTINLNSV